MQRRSKCIDLSFILPESVQVIKLISTRRHPLPHRAAKSFLNMLQSTIDPHPAYPTITASSILPSSSSDPDPYSLPNLETIYLIGALSCFSHPAWTAVQPTGGLWRRCSSETESRLRDGKAEERGGGRGGVYADVMASRGRV